MNLVMLYLNMMMKMIGGLRDELPVEPPKPVQLKPSIPDILPPLPDEIPQPGHGVEAGDVEVCNPYGVASSVMKLDYGKVPATDLSSFDIALWYTELQEMI